MYNANRFQLDVISKHPNFKNQKLKKHLVDNREFIGVWGNEPFAIKFYNGANEPVQVRLSLDGTDVLTAEKATVDPKTRMWVVKPYSTLELEAWPETNEAGARFIFATEENAVAAHTHGDMSHKGVIAAAVFTEAEVYRSRGYDYSVTGNLTKGVGDVLRSQTLSARGLESSFSNDADGLDSMDLNRERGAVPAAAVGAGETIKQAIGSATGLRSPKLSEVISFNYIWWDELQAKIAQANAVQSPTGFHDYVRSPVPLANLGGVPRVGASSSVVAQAAGPVLERFAP